MPLNSRLLVEAHPDVLIYLGLEVLDLLLVVLLHYQFIQLDLFHLFDMILFGVLELPLKFRNFSF